MYSIEFTQNDPFGGPKIVTPQGQHVSVTVLRDRGAKVTHREIVTADPMIGFIRRVHDNGVSMAYRYNGFLLLETDGYRPRELARLFSPEIQEWNKDGLIYVGWSLERWEDEKVHQVVQLWWIRQLEGLSAKPKIEVNSSSQPTVGE
jgi:hypothetical protein